MKDWQIALLAVVGGVLGSELIRRYREHSQKSREGQGESAPWGSGSPKRIIRHGGVI